MYECRKPKRSVTVGIDKISYLTYNKAIRGMAHDHTESKLTDSRPTMLFSKQRIVLFLWMQLGLSKYVCETIRHIIITPKCVICRYLKSRHG